jgi:predicted flavoprotein YhiN
VSEKADIAVVGGGAAGVMAAIWAARRAPAARLVVLEGARKLGTKILIAGGGRCNVTHEAVRAEDFAGSSPPAIRKVLQRFDVEPTIEFFAELGVTLKREDTGKLFPTTDRARTVLRRCERRSRARAARSPSTPRTRSAPSRRAVFA